MKLKNRTLCSKVGAERKKKNISWHSVVGIATSYRLDNRGLEFESQKSHEFSLLHVVQTGSGIHPTSYPMGTGGSIHGGKVAGA
jgi:hypothetical protein